MRGASRESLAAAQDRVDGLLGVGGDPVQLGDQLFNVVDLLDGQPAVRAALTDPGRSGEDKAALATGLLTGKVAESTADLVAGMARGRWSAGRDLPDALELLAVQSLVTASQRSGHLDELEDQLFRFSRIVEGEAALRSALTDRALPRERKEQLVQQLLGGRATDETVRLVARVVTRPRGRSLEKAVAEVAQQAAERRQRLVATVTAAVPLTEQQRDRLAAALHREYGHEVHLNVLVDPEVMGGLRVAVGDEVLDATISNKLESATRRLAS